MQNKNRKRLEIQLNIIISSHDVFSDHLSLRSWLIVALSYFTQMAFMTYFLIFYV